MEEDKPWIEELEEDTINLDEIVCRMLIKMSKSLTYLESKFNKFDSTHWKERQKLEKYLEDNYPEEKS